MFLHAGFEGAKSGGLKTKLSDIIIIAGLALIGTEDNIDIKHVSKCNILILMLF